MRSAMCSELPCRRSGGRMRDGSIARWENAAWRMWSQELRSTQSLNHEGHADQTTMLKSKLEGLTALPCLLCGTGNLCSCLNTCRNPQENDGTITPPTPSQGLLDECFRDGVLDGSDED